MTATTTYLPTDCFNEIKGFLLFKKDERRRPPHFTAINELINKAVAPLERPVLYREAGAVLNDFINRRPTGALTNSGAYWRLHELMEWYDDYYLFNNKATLYDINDGNKAAFYMTYILKAGLLNSAPPPPPPPPRATAATTTDIVVAAPPANNERLHKLGLYIALYLVAINVIALKYYIKIKALK